jgi:integrase
MSGTYIAVVLYKSKRLANGEHPLMLRVTKNRKPSYISLGVSSTVELWDAVRQRPKPRHPDRNLIEAIIAKKLSEYKTKILELKNDEKELSGEGIIEAVEQPRIKKSVNRYFDETISKLLDAKKVGNANLYKDTKRALCKYKENEEIAFKAIDAEFLNGFEEWMRSNGCKETSMSVYLRTLRSLFNKAIRDKVISEKAYPFREYKISKLDTKTKKRAISKEQVRKIADYVVPEDSLLFDARQYFLFSYYTQGMNFTDIAFLKWSDISEDRIQYVRAKTGKSIQCIILPPVAEIIDYWKPVTGSVAENYVFPILSKETHVSAVQIDNRIHKVLTRINKRLNELGKELGIGSLTTYVARHSFATALKRSGVQTSIISELMGHASESVTQIYLDGFENKVLDDAMMKLL